MCGRVYASIVCEKEACAGVWWFWVEKSRISIEDPEVIVSWHGAPRGEEQAPPRGSGY